MDISENLDFKINPLFAVKINDIESNIESNIEGNIESNIESNIKKECRICLEETEESNNKLINVCECKGSLMYVHEVCIKKWIKTQRGNTVCEICKTEYKKEELKNHKIKNKTKPINICEVCMILLSITVIVVILMLIT